MIIFTWYNVSVCMQACQSFIGEVCRAQRARAVISRVHIPAVHSRHLSQGNLGRPAARKCRRDALRTREAISHMPCQGRMSPRNTKGKPRGRARAMSLSPAGIGAEARVKQRTALWFWSLPQRDARAPARLHSVRHCVALRQSTGTVARVPYTLAEAASRVEAASVAYLVARTGGPTCARARATPRAGQA